MPRPACQPSHCARILMRSRWMTSPRRHTAQPSPELRTHVGTMLTPRSCSVPGCCLPRLLAAEGAPAGRVRLIFEPAEEALPGGAIEVIEEGNLKDVGAIYGLHCDPKINVGTLGESGTDHICGRSCRDRSRWPGGHTARPELTVDLVQVIARRRRRSRSELKNSQQASRSSWSSDR